MNLKTASVLAQREAALAAAFPFVALSLLNHLYVAKVFQISPIWYWVADIFQFVGAPAFGWYFFLRPAGIRTHDYGLAFVARQHKQGDGLGFAALVAVILLTAYWPVQHLARLKLWTLSPAFPIGLVLPSDFSSRLLIAVWMSVTAALIEEAVWRGLSWYYLSQILPARGRRLCYVLITSAAFAVAHSEQGPAGVIGAFWFGVLAAGLYTKIRSLWPIVLGHFFADMLLFGPWR